jgi:glycosyltransferase involved in cell wall biosynthesis
MGVPVVHTLHNYRTICAASTLLRNGVVCEDCLTRGLFQAVRHRCYHNSALGSLAVVRGIKAHRDQGTWQHDVDRLIALSSFAQKTFVRAGFPASKIVVKPNFVPDPGRGRMGPPADFLFIGRLSPEKGVHVLLEACRGNNVPLTIIGDGPERARLQAMAEPAVHFAGKLQREKIQQYLSSALALIVPSLWYEGCPLVVLEAYAAGVPVIASNIGGLGELVQDGKTGLVFAPGDSQGLARCMDIIESQPALQRALGLGARAAYDALYSPAICMRRLTEIYQAATEEMERTPFHATGADAIDPLHGGNAVTAMR